MSIVAIVGSGSLGGSIAHTIAVRGRVREVRLIDSEERDRAGEGARHPSVIVDRRLQHARCRDQLACGCRWRRRDCAGRRSHPWRARRGSRPGVAASDCRDGDLRTDRVCRSDAARAHDARGARAAHFERSADRIGATCARVSAALAHGVVNERLGCGNRDHSRRSTTRCGGGGVGGGIGIRPATNVPPAGARDCRAERTAAGSLAARSVCTLVGGIAGRRGDRSRIAPAALVFRRRSAGDGGSDARRAWRRWCPASR